MKVNQTVVLVGLAAVAAAGLYWFVLRPGAKAAAEVAVASNNVGRWTNPMLDSITNLFDGPLTDESPITGPASLGYKIGATIRGWFTSDDEPAAVEPRPATVAYDYGYGAGSGPLRPGLAAPASDSYFQYWGT